MPSKGGGGGTASAPQLSIPTGLYQDLSEIEGLGQFGQNLFNPLASMTNWAADIATGGNAQQIGSFGANTLATGPSITIGDAKGPPGHDTWTTQFNPATGQITFTNAQTGGQFEEGVTSSQAQQYFANQGGGPQTLQQWQQLYQEHQAGQTAGGTGGGGPAGSRNPFGGGPGGSEAGLLGPQLNEAWTQIQDLAKQSGKTSKEAALLQAEGNKQLTEATTGTGLFPSQQAYVNEAVTAEEEQLSQQLSSEGLGASTSNAILRGEASQQGAATAGQLIQGNIQAAQGTLQLAQGYQQLTDAQMQAVSSLSMTFQGTMFSEALSGYGALGSMMNTLGNLYGIDVSGYSAIMNAENQNNSIQAQLSEANAGLAAGAASSLGQGLGGILSNMSSLGSSGGGGGFGGLGSLFGGGASALGGTSLEAGGTVGALGSFTGGGISGAIGTGASAGGGILGGIGSALGTVGSWIGPVIGAIAAF